MHDDVLPHLFLVSDQPFVKRSQTPPPTLTVVGHTLKANMRIWLNVMMNKPIAIDTFYPGEATPYQMAALALIEDLPVLYRHRFFQTRHQRLPLAEAHWTFPHTISYDEDIFVRGFAVCAAMTKPLMWPHVERVVMRRNRLYANIHGMNTYIRALGATLSLGTELLYQPEDGAPPALVAALKDYEDIRVTPFSREESFAGTG